MVALGLSEFTFGYAFLYEQTQRSWQEVRAVPILPSLQQEASTGWDAHLPLVGKDYYYQFKLSERLSRSNAKYIKDGTYQGPYFRSALHKASGNRQHRRLKDHAQTNPNTYYVAPEVSNLDEFNSAFLASQLTDSCRIISLVDCEDLDDSEQHYITFEANNASWILHSDEKNRHEKSYFGRDLEEIYRRTKPTWESIDQGFALRVFQKTAESAKRLIGHEERGYAGRLVPLLNFDPVNQTREQVLVRTSQVLSVFFGLTLVVIGQAP